MFDGELGDIIDSCIFYTRDFNDIHRYAHICIRKDSDKKEKTDIQ